MNPLGGHRVHRLPKRAGLVKRSPDSDSSLHEFAERFLLLLSHHKGFGMYRTREQQLAASDERYRRNFNGVDPSTPPPNFERDWDDHDVPHEEMNERIAKRHED